MELPWDCDGTVMALAWNWHGTAMKCYENAIKCDESALRCHGDPLDSMRRHRTS